MNGQAPFCAAADWGTTSFRLWILDRSGEAIAERRSDEGLIVAGRKGFADVLEGHLGALGAAADLPVVLCGMVGARTGWVEARYLDAPTPLGALADEATAVPGLRRRVVILPGVAQREAERPDVMRGEETKLLGLGGTSGLVVMPGTHTKWAELRDGALAGFSTFMTGEIFAHLRFGESSVLRAIVADAPEVDPDGEAFRAAVREGFATPALLTNRLFGVRAGSLLDRFAPSQALARLSGLLVGLEMAGARERFGTLGPLTLVAAGPAERLYRRALEEAGIEDVAVRGGDACVRAGLFAAARRIFDGRQGTER